MHLRRRPGIPCTLDSFNLGTCCLHFRHTCSSIYIIFSTNNRLFLPLYASPRLWNQLPASPCQPGTNLSSSDPPSPIMCGTSSIGSVDSPLSSSVTPHSFIPGLKLSFSANLPTVGYPFFFRTDSADFLDRLPILLIISVFYFFVFLFLTLL